MGVPERRPPKAKVAGSNPPSAPLPYKIRGFGKINSIPQTRRRRRRGVRRSGAILPNAVKFDGLILTLLPACDATDQARERRDISGIRMDYERTGWDAIRHAHQGREVDRTIPDQQDARTMSPS